MGLPFKPNGANTPMVELGAHKPNGRWEPEIDMGRTE